MKIAMIGQKGIPSYSGGIENHVEHLSSQLAASGNDVLVYARSWYTPRGVKLYNGVRIVHTPSIHTKHLDAISHTFTSILHACFIARAEVIHIHGVGPSLLAFLPRILRPSAAVITTFHCIDRKQEKWGRFAQRMLQLGERACVKAAHATIAVSRVLKDYIAKEYREHVYHVPNGIHPVRVATNDVLLEPFGLHSHGYIAMVSRLVPHKGQHTLIEAWKQVQKMRPDLVRDQKLAIIGGSSFTDDYQKKLESMAAGDNSIILTGNQSGDTLKALFAGARFIVHPSTAEGLPIAVLEAMSYGKAVIGSDIPEHCEILDDYGVTFPVGNVDVLAQEMIFMLEDRMQAAAIGHAAREFVETQYHWNEIAHDVAQIYRTYCAMQDEGVLVTQE